MSGSKKQHIASGESRSAKFLENKTSAKISESTVFSQRFGSPESIYMQRVSKNMDLRVTV